MRANANPNKKEGATSRMPLVAINKKLQPMAVATIALAPGVCACRSAVQAIHNRRTSATNPNTPCSARRRENSVWASMASTEKEPPISGGHADADPKHGMMEECVQIRLQD